jgi:hypothetical protein
LDSGIVFLCSLATVGIALGPSTERRALASRRMRIALLVVTLLLLAAPLGLDVLKKFGGGQASVGPAPSLRSISGATNTGIRRFAFKAETRTGAEFSSGCYFDLTAALERWRLFPCGSAVSSIHTGIDHLFAGNGGGHDDTVFTPPVSSHFGLDEFADYVGACPGCGGLGTVSSDVLTSFLGAYGVFSFPIALHVGLGSGGFTGNTAPCVGCGSPGTVVVDFLDSPDGGSGVNPPATKPGGIGSPADQKTWERVEMPELGSLWLLAIGLGGLGILWKRRLSIAHQSGRAK